MKAFLDIETGGYSIDKNGVCEIGLVVVNDNLEPIAQFHTYIQPYYRPCGIELVSYKDDAMAVNGLTVEKLIAEGVPLEFAMKRMQETISYYKISGLIGHNIPAFDVPRVNYIAGKCGNAGMLMGMSIECTLKMSREKWPAAKSHKQPDLLKELGIANPNAHTAIGDCLGNIELYKKITGWNQ